MLHLIVFNDSTGTLEKANYDVEVRINYKTIAKGRVEGYHRENGAFPLLALALKAVLREDRRRRRAWARSWLRRLWSREH